VSTITESVGDRINTLQSPSVPTGSRYICKNMSPPMSNDDTNGDHTPPSAARGGAAARSSLTPTRPTNNYAAIDTPIASAKRSITKKRTPVPSSAKKMSSTSSSNNGGGSGGGAPRTPIRTPKTPSNDNAASSKHKDARYANLSPMHNVKAVPRDSHHVVPKVKRVEQDEETTDSGTMCSIPATESTLSIVTEAPDVADPPVTTAASTLSSSSFSAAVGRKVDALFSPVLSFLNAASVATGGGGEEEELDGGEKLANVEQLGSVNVSAHLTSSSLVEKKIEEEEEEVQNMVREALRQAKTDLQIEEEYNSHIRTDTFDDIPGMTNTDSSGSNIIDADGDVAMADCYNNYQRGGGEKVNTEDITAYLKVTLNDHDEEVEAEEYYDDEDDEDEFNPYMFIKMLPPYEYAVPPGWRSRPKALPPADSNSHPICLVLDLDETLVHGTVEPVADADMVFPVEFNGMNYKVHVRCRPFLTEFLEAVSKKFEVVIFTASQQVYADKLLDKIDPGEFMCSMLVSCFCAFVCLFALTHACT